MGADSSAAALPEPGKGYRWLVLLAVSVAMFANYYVFDALNPVGPLLEKLPGFTQARLGALDSAYNVAALLVLIAGGVVIDRVGTKRAMIAFAAVAAAGGLLIAFSPGGYWGMAAGRFVLGLGSEPLIVAATTVLGRWFKGKELSFAMALNLSLSRLGSVAADNSGSWAGGLFDSWQRPLFLAAGIGSVSVLAGTAYALLERNAERRFSLGRAAATDKLVLGDLWRFGRAYWWIVGLCVTFYAAVFPFRRFANLLFVDAHGVSAEAAGHLNGLLPTTALFATPLFGLLADRMGRRAQLMALGSLLLVPPFLLMAYTRLPLGLPVALLGVSFSLVPAVLWPSVTYLVDEKRLGTAYALMTFLQQVGWAAMAWAIGAANDHFGASAQNPSGYVPGLWMFAALALLGLGFSFLLWREERGPAGHGLETVRPGPGKP
jgi:MFS family permease